MIVFTRPPNPETVPRWEVVGETIVPSNTAAYAIEKNLLKGLDTETPTV